MSPGAVLGEAVGPVGPVAPADHGTPGGDGSGRTPRRRRRGPLGATAGWSDTAERMTRAGRNSRRGDDQWDRWSRLPAAERERRSRNLFEQRIRLVDQHTRATERLTELRDRGASAAEVEAVEREVRRLRRRIERVTTEISQMHLGLALGYVRQFVSYGSSVDTDDFMAAAVLGLMRAIKRYDPSRGAFSPWAHQAIKREVLRAVHAIEYQTISQSDFELRPRVRRAYSELLRIDPHTPPTVEELADASGLSPARVRRILEPPQLLSADASPRGETDDGYPARTRAEVLADDSTSDPGDLVNADALMAAIVEEGLPVLDERERFVVVRRFGLDGEPPQTLKTLGKLLGLSRETVRQTETRARSKLSHPVVLQRILARL